MHSTSSGKGVTLVNSYRTARLDYEADYRELAAYPGMEQLTNECPCPNYCVIYLDSPDDMDWRRCSSCSRDRSGSGKMGEHGDWCDYCHGTGRALPSDSERLHRLVQVCDYIQISEVCEKSHAIFVTAIAKLRNKPYRGLGSGPSPWAALTIALLDIGAK